MHTHLMLDQCTRYPLNTFSSSFRKMREVIRGLQQASSNLHLPSFHLSMCCTHHLKFLLTCNTLLTTSALKDKKINLKLTGKVKMNKEDCSIQNSVLKNDFQLVRLKQYQLTSEETRKWLTSTNCSNIQSQYL